MGQRHVQSIAAPVVRVRYSACRPPSFAGLPALPQVYRIRFRGAVTVPIGVPAPCGRDDSARAWWERRIAFFGCHRHIELNPVRAGMVEHPGEYPWSSYGQNAQGETNPVIRPHVLYQELGRDARSRQAAYLRTVSPSTRSGAGGSDSFGNQWRLCPWNRTIPERDHGNGGAAHMARQSRRPGKSDDGAGRQELEL